MERAAKAQTRFQLLDRMMDPFGSVSVEMYHPEDSRKVVDIPGTKTAGGLPGGGSERISRSRAEEVRDRVLPRRR